MTVPLSVQGGASGPTEIFAGFDDLLAVAHQLDLLAAATADATNTVASATESVRWALVDRPVDADELDARLGLIESRLRLCGAQVGALAQAVRAGVHLYAHVDVSPDVAAIEHLVTGATRVGLGLLDAADARPAAGAREALAGAPELVHALAPVATALEIAYAVLPDGQAVVHDLGTDHSCLAMTAPHDLADLMAQLALRNSGRHGEISVSFVVGADGVRRAIVDIPGTKSWNPLPNHDITSVGTDLRSITGAGTSYEDGVLTALARAGVGPRTPVLLVGHSEGGIIAVDAARDARRTGRFDVTHVLTAGAPIGLVAGSLPSSVQVLALENSADVVPATDGATNPVRANVTTVTTRIQRGSVGGNHDLGQVYQPEASAADRSTNRSIRAFVRSATGFLDSRTETTRTYWIRRG